MSIRNNVNLIGNVGQDPEIKLTESTNKMASFSLATTDSWTNKQGEKIEDTQWHSCVVFGKLADIVESYVKKGSKLFVSGKIKYNKYQGSDGVEKWSTSIIVNEIELNG